jgi:hypothetical protein
MLRILAKIQRDQMAYGDVDLDRDAEHRVASFERVAGPVARYLLARRRRHRMWVWYTQLHTDVWIWQGLDRWVAVRSSEHLGVALAHVLPRSTVFDRNVIKGMVVGSDYVAVA